MNGLKWVGSDIFTFSSMHFEPNFYIDNIRYIPTALRLEIC